MKIGEAQQKYRENRAVLVEQKRALVKQRNTLQEKMKTTENGKELFAQEAATLELSINAVNEKFDQNQKVLDQLGQQYAAIWNAEVTRQQSDAMSEAAEDLVKIMEVARRIAKGAKVPATDEKKLMDYSMEMYMAAKNAAMLLKLKKREEYDSLWDEDKEEKEYDPKGKAENAEASVELPDIEVGEAAPVEASAAPIE